MEQPSETMICAGFQLRRWRPDDVDEVHRAVNESLPHLRPWMGWAAGTYNLTAAREFLTQMQRNWRSGDEYDYAIEVGAAVVGGCGLVRRIGPHGLEIGYWLHPAHTGRGIATQAAAALVEQAFTLPGIDHVQIWHDAANTASAGIPRRLGFVEVARRTPPRDPLTSGEVGIDVVWELTRPGG